MFGFLKRRRRARIRQQPFPPAWLAIIERNVPMYARLSPDDQAELRRKVLVFVAEKNFEGAGGLEMRDEVRVTIAAQACILLLRLDDDEYYPRLRSIVVYPDAYRVPGQQRDGAVVAGDAVHLGESWQHGAVVLAWNSARRGAVDPRDGKNVILHEFAHQLDQEDGAADGTPELEAWACYAPWGRVLSEHYLALRKVAGRGGKAVLDTYGATNEAEFFAVATEAFFERPALLQARHPDLYEELARYFNQDPAAPARRD
ncbi:M90 family metallopeptidase [Longimicrobium sp.]|uniref:M90 family metallopeptidase n=1 Tax=Longimicrobium sp. TaxID=2029185 RepID=UPI002E32CBD9|nr:M90 family metallopeptidase [Longimicrobium sp.]HEX6040508.1 M90 family metallopeptidase [Longimicrobium sp.]